MAQKNHLWRGYGQSAVSASTTEAEIDLGNNYAYNCSVYNTGSNTLFVQIAKDYGVDSDDTKDQLASWTKANGVPVAPGQTFSWAAQLDEDKGRRITKLFYATTTGTTTFNVSFS